jgi:hypothetical protein
MCFKLINKLYNKNIVKEWDKCKKQRWKLIPVKFTKINLLHNKLSIKKSHK